MQGLELIPALYHFYTCLNTRSIPSAYEPTIILGLNKSWTQYQDQTGIKSLKNVSSPSTSLVLGKKHPLILGPVWYLLIQDEHEYILVLTGY